MTLFEFDREFSTRLLMRLYDISQWYLGVIFAISAFRTIVYTLAPEAPARVKISKEAWDDTRVREVAIAWTSTIRTFMAFRTGVTFAALCMHAGREKFWFCLINCLLDLKLMHGVTSEFAFGKQKGNVAILHQHNYLPIILQGIMLGAGIVYIAATLMRVPGIQ